MHPAVPALCYLLPIGLAIQPRPLLSQCNANTRKGTEMKRVKRKRPKKDERRTAAIVIGVSPSVKRMAVTMAKAEGRSLGSFISRLIEAEEPLSHFRKGL